MATAWNTILPAVAKLVHAGRRPISMTLTGGSTTTAVCSTYAGPTTTSAYRDDGRQLFVSNASGHVAPEGTFAWVTSGGYAPATGTWTIAPALTALASGMTAIMFADGLTYDDYFAAYNRVISAHYWPRYAAMSLLTDGDMETSGVTGWTAIAGATRTKTTTAGQVYTGTTALSVAMSASGDGVQSASVPVVPGYETVYVSVLGLLSNAAKSFTVELYDVTNSATIGTAVTVNGSDWTEVRFSQTPPATCENVAVRVKSSATSTFSVYVDYVQILTTGNQLLPLPSQVTHAQDVQGVWYPQESFSIGNYLYKPPLLSLEDSVYVPLKDYAAVVPMRAQIARPNNMPLFWRFRQKDSELSATTITALAQTTFADVDAIVYGTAAELARVVAERPQIASHIRDQWLQKAYGWGVRFSEIENTLDLEQREKQSGVKAVAVP